MFGDRNVSDASKDIQEAAHKAFKLCFAGDLVGLRAHLDQNPNLPLNLVDVNQHSMAAVALLGEGNKDVIADLVKELLDRVEERYVDILKAKMKKDEVYFLFSFVFLFFLSFSFYCLFSFLIFFHFSFFFIF